MKLAHKLTGVIVPRAPHVIAEANNGGASTGLTGLTGSPAHVSAIIVVLMVVGLFRIILTRTIHPMLTLLSLLIINRNMGYFCSGSSINIVNPCKAGACHAH